MLAAIFELTANAFTWRKVGITLYWIWKPLYLTNLGKRCGKEHVRKREQENTNFLLGRFIQINPCGTNHIIIWIKYSCTTKKVNVAFSELRTSTTYYTFYKLSKVSISHIVANSSRSIMLDILTQSEQNPWHSLDFWSCAAYTLTCTHKPIYNVSVGISWGHNVVKREGSVKWPFCHFTTQMGAAGKDRVLFTFAISPSNTEWILMALRQNTSCFTQSKGRWSPKWKRDRKIDWLTTKRTQKRKKKTMKKNTFHI